MASKPDYYHDLNRDVAIVSDRLDNLRVETDDLGRIGETLRAELAALRTEVALLRQRLDDHLKRVETADTRRWTLIGILVGALCSLASGLIVTLVTLARKGTP